MHGPPLRVNARERLAAQLTDVKLFYEDLKAEIERAFAGTDVTNAVRNRSRGYRGLLLAEHEDD